jgi:hypothetical protein
MKIDNRVVQRAVLSVKLFLIEISEITNKTIKPSQNERSGPRKNQAQPTLGQRRNANKNGRNNEICGRLGTLYKKSVDTAGLK